MKEIKFSIVDKLIAAFINCTIIDNYLHRSMNLTKTVPDAVPDGATSRARDERTFPPFEQRDCEISLSTPFPRIVTATVAIPFVCVWPTLASHLCVAPRLTRVFPFYAISFPRSFSHRLRYLSLSLSSSLSFSFSLPPRTLRIFEGRVTGKATGRRCRSREQGG